MRSIIWFAAGLVTTIVLAAIVGFAVVVLGNSIGERFRQINRHSVGLESGVVVHAYVVELPTFLRAALFGKQPPLTESPIAAGGDGENLK